MGDHKTIKLVRQGFKRRGVFIKKRNKRAVARCIRSYTLGGICELWPEPVTSAQRAGRAGCICDPYDQSDLQRRIFYRSQLQQAQPNGGHCRIAGSVVSTYISIVTNLVQFKLNLATGQACLQNQSLAQSLALISATTNLLQAEKSLENFEKKAAVKPAPSTTSP